LFLKYLIVGGFFLIPSAAFERVMRFAGVP